MLRLNKTISRKTTLHADHDEEDLARWQAMSSAEKQEVLEYLRCQAKTLHALCELGRQQDRDKNVGYSANGKPAN